MNNGGIDMTARERAERVWRQLADASLQFATVELRNKLVDAVASAIEAAVVGGVPPVWGAVKARAIRARAGFAEPQSDPAAVAGRHDPDVGQDGDSQQAPCGRPLVGVDPAKPGTDWIASAVYHDHPDPAEPQPDRVITHTDENR